MSDLGSDGSRQPVSHGPQPAGHEETPLLVYLQELGGKHLVLPHVSKNDSLVEQPVDGVQHIFWRHNGTGLHGQRMLLLPLLYLGSPPFRLTGRHILQHLGHRFFGVRHDGHVYLHVLGNGRRVDINVHDLGMRREGMELPGDPVIEPCSDGEQKVTFIHRHIAGISTVHSQVADIKRMICGNGPPAHNGGHHRDVGLLHHLCEFRPGMGDIDAAPRQEQRLLRLAQHLDGPLQLADMYMGVRLVAPDIYVRGILPVSQFRHHVLGKIHQHRSRSSGAGDIEGLLQDPSQVFSSSYGNSVLGDTPGDPYDIYFLEGVVSDQMAGHLSGKAHQGHAVIIGSGQPGHQVGRSRSAGHQTDSHLACGSGIGVRLMDQGDLLPGQDHLDPVLPVQFVADINGTGPRIAEHGIHAFFPQRFHQQFVSTDLLHIHTSLSTPLPKKCPKPSGLGRICIRVTT